MASNDVQVDSNDADENIIETDDNYFDMDENYIGTIFNDEGAHNFKMKVAQYFSPMEYLVMKLKT